MRVFLDQSQKENIKFYEHCFRIHPRSISREERLRVRSSGVRNIGAVILSWCGYVDDLVLFLLSKLSLQNASVLLNDVFTKFGLSTNVQKTDTIMLNLPPDLTYPSSITELNRQQLINVLEFKYLGACVNHNQPNFGEREINHRIQLAVVKFSQLSNFLQNF